MENVRKGSRVVEIDAALAIEDELVSKAILISDDEDDMEPMDWNYFN